MRLDELFEAEYDHPLPRSKMATVDDPFHMPKSRIIPRKDEADILAGIRGLITAAQNLPRLSSKVTPQQRSQIGRLVGMLSMFAGTENDDYQQRRAELGAEPGTNRLYGYY